MNRYVYCRDNPIIYADPSGHFFWIPIIVGAVIGASAAGTHGQIFSGDAWSRFDWDMAWKGAIIGGAAGGLGYAAAGLSGASGALGGMTAGAMSAGANNGNIINGMTFGALVGGFCGYWAGGIECSGGFWGAVQQGATQGAINGAGFGATFGYKGGAGNIGDVAKGALSGATIGAITGGIIGAASYNFQPTQYNFGFNSKNAINGTKDAFKNSIPKGKFTGMEGVNDVGQQYLSNLQSNMGGVVKDSLIWQGHGGGYALFSINVTRELITNLTPIIYNGAGIYMTGGFLGDWSMEANTGKIKF